MKQVKITIAALLAGGLLASCGGSDKSSVAGCSEQPLAELADSLKEDIRLNQLGYYPKAKKSFVVAGSQSGCFEIVDTAGTIVYSGSLIDKGFWAGSHENLKSGDFSDFQNTGQYTIRIADKGTSHQFDITSQLYNDMLTAASKTYYYQRMSTELKEEHAGQWHRPASQMDDTVFFHVSTGKVKETWTRPDSIQKMKRPYAHEENLPPFINASKGWFDAADFNKYTVNAGSAIGFLLMTYEKYPQLFPDNQLNIPESGSGQSDLLDEIKWELDWMQAMQDEDGGVFVKMSELGWEWAVMPHEWIWDRYIVGKSTSASLNFAASFAMAARNYADSALTADYIERAEKAWAWAVANPEVYFTDTTTPDVGSGNYPDTDVSEEFIWAASELYIATKKKEYLDYVVENSTQPKFKVCSWASFPDNIGYISLLNSGAEIPAEMKTKLEKGMIVLADQFLDSIQAIPYGLPSSLFEWGSNSEFLARMSIVGAVYEITKDRKYLDAMTTVMDYIMGKNATKYSFVTGFGDRPPMNIHHRQSFADGIEDPIPGFLSGGANDQRQEDILLGCPPCKVKYASRYPATSFMDVYDSYASNEVTINWNAVLINNIAVIIANEKELQ